MGNDSGMGAMWRHRRVLGASLIGTAVEFYDFYIYATAASLIFPALFFPASSPTAQLMASYGSLSLAFFARPLGAAVFGHYGDRVGRKVTLVISLMLMGGSTLAIGFLPTYQTIGWWAPLILCILRFGQGLGLGGEWGGAALLAVENAPPGWRARFGMFPQLGAPVGFLAANGMFLALGLWLSDEAFFAWGWRLPFLGSAVLVFLGLWVRLKLTETPEFAAAQAEAPPPAVPLATLFQSHLGAAIAGTFAVVACFAIYYIATAFALGYGTTILKIDREIFLAAQLGAILFMALSIILAGWWADRSSPTRVLVIGCVGTVLMGIAFGPAMGTGALLPIFLILSLALFMMGFVYGPLGAYLPALFPVQLRYTGASFSFNLGGIIGGALAPIVATWLIAAQGIELVGLYMSAAAAISLAGLWWTSRHGH
ncbi:MFS family permease [Sphingobium wenxiniae]|uniref:Putative MFS family arabinose efflux permease n=1 Tax=Sphingobium wenxiniae (strain DSM 21828 / CGMCC 1.7748 / JZ-1) TaxID=595605 RepID=A0A562KGP5_SPHWJ|nr:MULTISPECIES: MFS transporter [Sphingobium]MBB6190615.1 MFS family permease [Sphingobium wenxiniae]TWH94393.1 putative MFS family arabinose efflux permease [Sphingobium wenxiniae]WRD76666.1 MFS transporter [Sphingobium baderi]